ncbi:MAG: glycosyltransferase family 2 protein [Thomasclavelia sp.]
MISVCMATYNGEKYIKDQLLSILSQISDNDEIIISDDGSTDNTKDIVATLNDSRIIWIENKGVHGFTANFENALKHASGDIIFLSDQDDIWRSKKVEITLEKMKIYDFVISDCITVDNCGNVLQDSRFKSFGVKKGIIRHFIKSRYLGCCMAFKKEVLNVALPFPKKYNLVEHDIWLALIGMCFFNFDLIHEPLIYYRRHMNNVSNGGFEKGYPLLNKLYRRLYRAFCLLLVYMRKKNDKYGGKM